VIPEGLAADSHRFTPGLFTFLRELKRHNSKTWFEAHRSRYLAQVQRPFLAFIRAFGPRLIRMSPHLVASAKPIGGSMFKIHRDVRFTKDKTPYHTRVAARFLHGRDPLGHGPGFYLHLEPDDCSAGSGIWLPPAAQALAIRNAIIAAPDAWKAITRRGAFAKQAAFWGESLKRPPAGLRADHPLIDDLKRKSFITFVDFTEAEVCAPDFLGRFTEACRIMAPFNRFLAEAIGLPW